MSLLNLIGFSGEVPRLQPRQLDNAAATFAQNVRLETGGLVPVRQSKNIHTFTGMTPGSIKSIYLHNSTWYAWTTHVKAAPGPVASDRLYYTGDGTPKVRIGATVYDLAVPRATTALTVTMTGTGTGDIWSRLYVYTWVTSLDEESEPNPVSNTIDWQEGTTVTLSGFEATPAGRGINRQRIYRSQTSAGGTTQLYFIAERSATAASFVDTVPIDGFAEAIPSMDWNAPPPDLDGLIALPNGVMAAFAGKQLYFSEPWHPHAWPEKYILTTDFTIIGLGAYGTNVLVCTDGQPYIVSGTEPASMVMEKLEIALPCLNPNGIVDMGYSIAYPSHDGLVVVSNAGPQNASEGLFTRDDWLLMNPSTFIAGSRSRKYFASFNYIDNAAQEQIGTIVFDLGGMPFVKREDFFAEAMFSDVKSGAMFYLSGIDVYEYDARLQSNKDMFWRSKPFVLNGDVNPFAVMQVDAVDTVSDDEEAAFEANRLALLAANESMLVNGVDGGFNMTPLNSLPIDDDSLNDIPDTRHCHVRLFADGVQVASVTEFNRPVRLPSGYKAQIFHIEVTGNTGISQIRAAHSMLELRSG